MIREVRDHLGALNVLFLYAGVSRPGPIETTDEVAFDTLVDVNVKGTFFMLHRALPVLEDGASVVVTVGAGEGLGSAMTAAKGALVPLVRAAAIELAPRRIRVNAVSPGLIDPPAYASMGVPRDVVESWADQIPHGRIGAPADIAETVAFPGVRRGRLHQVIPAANGVEHSGRKVSCDPAAVGDGHVRVLGAVPDVDTTRHVVEVEAPALGKGEAVVDPPVDTSAQRVSVGRGEILVEVAVRCGTAGGRFVAVCDQPPRGPFDDLSERALTLSSRQPLADVDGVHPAEEVQSLAARGATPAITSVRTTPGMPAAQARACGPPPDHPASTNRCAPTALDTVSASATTSTTDRPGDPVDAAQPARAKVI